MSNSFVRILLAAGVLISSIYVSADPELNRCLTTNKSPNRFEICYGEMRSRAFEQSRAERKARTDAILKQLIAEEEARKQQQSQSTDTPVSTPQSEPRTTQPSPPKSAPAPTPRAQPNVVPLQKQNDPFYGKSQQRPTSIFGSPPQNTPSTGQPNQTPGPQTDPGSPVMPQSEPKTSNPDSETKPSYPIQYY